MKNRSFGKTQPTTYGNNKPNLSILVLLIIIVFIGYLILLFLKQQPQERVHSSVFQKAKHLSVSKEKTTRMQLHPDIYCKHSNHVAVITSISNIERAAKLSTVGVAPKCFLRHEISDGAINYTFANEEAVLQRYALRPIKAGKVISIFSLSKTQPSKEPPESQVKSTGQKKTVAKTYELNLDF